MSQDLTNHQQERLWTICCTFKVQLKNQTEFAFQSFTSDEHDCTAVHSNIFQPNAISLQDTAYLEKTSQKWGINYYTFTKQFITNANTCNDPRQVQWNYNKFGKECVLWKQNPHPLPIPENCGYYLLISHKPAHNKNPKNYKICVVWILFFTEYALT